MKKWIVSVLKSERILDHDRKIMMGLGIPAVIMCFATMVCLQMTQGAYGEKAVTIGIILLGVCLKIAIALIFIFAICMTIRAYILYIIASKESKERIGIFCDLRPVTFATPFGRGQKEKAKEAFAEKVLRGEY